MDHESGEREEYKDARIFTMGIPILICLAAASVIAILVMAFRV